MWLIVMFCWFIFFSAPEFLPGLFKNFPSLFGYSHFVHTSFFLLSRSFFLAELGLRCCPRAFSSCRELGGLLFVEVRGLLIVVASLVGRSMGCRHAGSVAVARGL